MIFNTDIYEVDRDYSIFQHEITVNQYKLRDNAKVDFCRKFLNYDFSHQLYHKILNKFNFRQYQGSGTYSGVHKTWNTPRLMTTLDLNDIDDKIEEIKEINDLLEELIGCKFNYVHFNYYRDGKDYIAYHGDKEALTDKGCIIASLSLGVERRFIMKHNKTKEKVEFSLPSGSLLIMKGPQTQRYWKHTVPKQLKVKEGRLNLTFRFS